MAQTSVPESGTPVVIPEAGSRESGTGAGWVFFAGVMMIIGGCFGALQGLAAIIKSGDKSKDVELRPDDVVSVPESVF